MEKIEKFINRGRYNYLPIYSYTLGHIATNSYTEGEVKTLAGKRFTWWEDESLMSKYPYIFINPVITGEYSEKINDTQRAFLRCEKGEQFIVSDSGGFQVISREDTAIVDNPEDVNWKEAKIHPETLAEWQYENSDAAMTLDIPPYLQHSKEEGWQPDKSYTEWRDDVFYPRLSKSIDYTERMVERWGEMDTENFQPIGVIHGQPGLRGDEQWQLMDEWFEAMREVRDFDAWSVAPRYITSIPINSFFLGWAVDRLKGYDHLHVLQVGNPSIKLLLMYAAKLSDLWITSDSGSWASATLWRQIFLPQSWSRSVTVSNRSDEEREDASEEAARFDMYPCNCEVCSHMDRHEGIEYVTEQESDSQNNAALCLHNLKMIRQVDDVLEGLLRAHFDTLLEDLAFHTERKERVKRYGNDFWHMVSRDMSDDRMGDLHSGFKFIKLSHEKGIEEAFDEMNITFNWRSNQDWTISHGGNAIDF